MRRPTDLRGPSPWSVLRVGNTLKSQQQDERINVEVPDIADYEGDGNLVTSTTFFAV
jgi:hypothetical protein